MRLLLDTHVFIWWDDNAESIPNKASDALADSDNVIFLSIASIWEMQIKSDLGRLKFNISIGEKVRSLKREE